MFLADRHSGDHSEKVCQLSIQHPVLQESVHNLPLDRHLAGVRRHRRVHRIATKVGPCTATQRG